MSAKTQDRHPPLDESRRKYFRRNYALGVFNGTMVILGNSLMSAQLILSALVYEQTSSKVLVAAVTAMQVLGGRLPQILISSLMEHRRRKKAFYVAATLLRLVAMAAMAAAVFWSSSAPGTAPLVAFMVAYGVFSIGQGCSSMPFFDMLADAVGPSRIGALFAFRHFTGYLLAIPCGLFVVQRTLDSVPEPRTQAYGLFIVAAMFVLGAGWCSFMLTREIGQELPPRRRAVRHMMADGFALLRVNSNYRGLLLLFCLGSFNGLAFIFYVPYGTDRLGAVGVSGLFLMTISIAQLASSLVWGWISHRSGNRICLVLMGVLLAVSAATALVAPHLPPVFAFVIPATRVAADLPLTVFLISLLVFGLGQQAGMVGMTGFMVETAPADRRPSYLAFLNTVTIPLSFVGLVAGLLVEACGLELSGVFVLAGLSSVLTAVVAYRLQEVRPGPEEDAGDSPAVPC